MLTTPQAIFSLHTKFESAAAPLVRIACWARQAAMLSLRQVNRLSRNLSAGFFKPE